MHNTLATIGMLSSKLAEMEEKINNMGAGAGYMAGGSGRYKKHHGVQGDPGPEDVGRR